MMYSTSNKRTQRAMKIFYKTTPHPLPLLDPPTNKLEELQLPPNALSTLKAALQTSTLLLPPSSRTHQTWTISLLTRLPTTP